MIGKTHRIGGLALGAAGAAFVLGGADLSTALLYTPVILTGAAFGSLIPDLDHAGAELSKKYKLASSIVRMFADHRGATHYVITVVIFSAIMTLLNYFIISSSNNFLVSIATIAIVQATIKLIFEYVPRKLVRKYGRTVRLIGFVVPAILGYGLNSICATIITYYCLGLVLGYISHLILDSFTLSGIPIGPWTTKKVRLAKLRTGESEDLVRGVCYILTALAICILVI